MPCVRRTKHSLHIHAFEMKQRCKLLVAEDREVKYDADVGERFRRCCEAPVDCPGRDEHHIAGGAAVCLVVQMDVAGAASDQQDLELVVVMQKTKRFAAALRKITDGIDRYRQKEKPELELVEI